MDAVFVLHDPLDWSVEVQVVVDVLRGGSPPGSGSGGAAAAGAPSGAPEGEPWQAPYFISNPDFVWAALYPEPRFAGGSFTDVVQLFYSRRFGVKCHVTKFGKPSVATFAFAESRLQDKAGPLERIYMVGDNPEGDIRGANAAGSHWVSNLVRTGIFRGENDLRDPADFVFDDVNACVAFVMQRERHSNP